MTRSLMMAQRMTRSRRLMSMATRQREEDWWTGVRELLVQLRPGDTMEATVRSVDEDGRALLRILGTDVRAAGAAMLKPGERVMVEVESVSPVTVVRVVGELEESRLGGDTRVVA